MKISSYTERKKKKGRLEVLSLWPSQEWGFRIGEKEEEEKVVEIEAE